MSIDYLSDENATNKHFVGSAGPNIDSARANLAGSFVNAFVNAGFGNDKLMVDAGEGDAWIYKNKDHGMMSAAASLGLSLLWDTDTGLSQVDRYTYSAEEYIKVISILAQGSEIMLNFVLGRRLSRNWYAELWCAYGSRCCISTAGRTRG